MDDLQLYHILSLLLRKWRMQSLVLMSLSRRGLEVCTMMLSSKTVLLWCLKAQASISLTDPLWMRVVSSRKECLDQKIGVVSASNSLVSDGNKGMCRLDVCYASCSKILGHGWDIHHTCSSDRAWRILQGQQYGRPVQYPEWHYTRSANESA